MTLHPMDPVSVMAKLTHSELHRQSVAFHLTIQQLDYEHKHLTLMGSRWIGDWENSRQASPSTCLMLTCGLVMSLCDVAVLRLLFLT